MIHLPNALAAWGTPEFNAVLKAEIEGLDPALLPLQQGIVHGSYYSGAPFEAMVVSCSEDAAAIRAKVGLFYTSIIAGCNCADDPTPPDEYREHCEALVRIDKASAEVAISLLEE